MPSKWNRNRNVVKVSVPPLLMTIPEDEDASSCRADDYDCFAFESAALQLQHHHHHNHPSKEFLDMAYLIAHERAEHRLPAFQRATELDAVAQEHAQNMARQRAVVHSVSNVQDLQHKLGAPDVGENITRGDSVYRMHQETMSCLNNNNNVNRANILSEHFDEFGSAMAFGSDGRIYCCQVFRKKGQLQIQ